MSGNGYLFLGDVGLARESTYATAVAATLYGQIMSGEYVENYDDKELEAIFADSEVIDTYRGVLKATGKLEMYPFNGAFYQEILRAASRAYATAAHLDWDVTSIPATTGAVGGGALAAGTYYIGVTAIVKEAATGNLYHTNISPELTVAGVTLNQEIPITWTAPAGGDLDSNGNLKNFPGFAPLKISSRNAYGIWLGTATGQKVLYDIAAGASPSYTIDGTKTLTAGVEPAKAYLTTFSPGSSTPPSLTMEFNENVGTSRQVCGLMFNKIAFTLKPAEIVKMAADFIAAFSTTDGITPTSPTFTLSPPMTGHTLVCYVTNQGVAFNSGYEHLVEGFNWELDNMLQPVYRGTGTPYLDEIAPGVRHIKASVEVSYKDLNYWKDLQNNQAKNFYASIKARALTLASRATVTVSAVPYTVDSFPNYMGSHIPSCVFTDFKVPFQPKRGVASMSILARKDQTIGYAHQLRTVSNVNLT